MQLRLVGVDIEGDWNRALLANAAAVSSADYVEARSNLAETTSTGHQALPDGEPLEAALHGCVKVLACETTRDSVSLFDVPAPRESTAILVGNEERGLPRRVLKLADKVVSIPMIRSGLSSLNVAVAGAIALYALTHDLARKRHRQSPLTQREVDLLIQAPADPHELGSLLRSAYAFGWRRVFLRDPHRVWFTDDPQVVLQSRAAARRAKNLLAVLPAEKLDVERYDSMLTVDGRWNGQPLSRLQLPTGQRLLLALSAGEIAADFGLPSIPVTVDYPNKHMPPRFRHTGSILLCMISRMFFAR
jgi:tRNA C32,U32 (ribose-2'-O)-methylase TrmJ